MRGSSALQTARAPLCPVWCSRQGGCPVRLSVPSCPCTPRFIASLASLPKNYVFLKLLLQVVLASKKEKME